MFLLTILFVEPSCVFDNHVTSRGIKLAMKSMFSFLPFSFDWNFFGFLHEESVQQHVKRFVIECKDSYENKHRKHGSGSSEGFSSFIFKLDGNETIHSLDCLTVRYSGNKTD